VSVSDCAGVILAHVVARQSSGTMTLREFAWFGRDRGDKSLQSTRPARDKYGSTSPQHDRSDGGKNGQLANVSKSGPVPECDDRTELKCDSTDFKGICHYGYESFIATPPRVGVQSLISVRPITPGLGGYYYSIRLSDHAPGGNMATGHGAASRVGGAGSNREYWPHLNSSAARTYTRHPAHCESPGVCPDRFPPCAAAA
jgi:hypothetical protein